MSTLRRRIMVSAGGDIEGFVDLGLPSGLLWATCNVGASNPEESGLYYSWGNAEEIDTTKAYSQSLYNASPGASLTGDIPHNATYDAAFANSGGKSRIPTEAEFRELIDNTVSEFSALNAVYGMFYYKKVNGQKVSDTYIFIPASGRYNANYVQYRGEQLYYWTATYSNANQGRRLNATSSNAGAFSGANKWFGFPVRGVFKPMFQITITLTGDSVSGITLTVTDSDGITHSGTTDSNGVVRLSGVASGSAKISAVGYAFTPSNINVNSSSRTFTIGCEYTLVDLGLPSGLLWAKGNLVKDSQGNYSIGEETDWGTYVSWGNIDGHNEGEGYGFSDANYNSTSGYSVAANIPSNDAAHDIALATLGSPWHLPTKEDFQELYDNTDSEWVADYNGTGVAGRKFMKKSDHSVYVFFPASGCYNGTSFSTRGTYGFYWSSSFLSATSAYNLYFSSSSVYPQEYDKRRNGLSVRPVFNP